MTWAVALWLAAGFVLIIRGGSYFVDSSVGIARALRVPRVIIGCTIVSVATTSPELIVSATASLQSNPGFAIGNAVGSVIGNIGFILALLVLIRPVKIGQGDFALPSLVMIVMGFVMLGLAWDLTLARWNGPVLIALGIAYLLFDFLRHARAGLADVGEADAEDGAKDAAAPSRSRPLHLHVVFFVVGVTMVVVGSRLLVSNGVKVAEWLGVPPMVIGLTLVAIGTSLPELVTAITSAAKGVSDLSVGNIVGANIMNLTLVTGTAALLSPKPLDMSRLSQLYNLPAMLVICIALVIFGRTHAALKRWEGAALLILYLAYLGGLFGFVRQ